MIRFRNSCPDVFFKKGALKIFSKFIGKHLCQSLFFDKVAGLKSVTLLKKRLWHRCFPVNFAKFVRTPFFIEHLRWLLLKIADNKNVEESDEMLTFSGRAFFTCVDNFLTRHSLIFLRIAKLNMVIFITLLLCEIIFSRGLIACVVVFIAFGVTQTKDGPFMRPHPGRCCR